MIKFNNVTFTYKGQREETGIKNINFHVKTGEAVLICGESGCGKSTITRIANGLIPHFYQGNLSGDIHINGDDIRDKTLYEINNHSGSVFQNPRTQFFNLDTNGEIVFGLENKNIEKQVILDRLHETVEKFGIENLQNRNIYKMSGGEQQKIACASTYCTNPDLYIFDEPSSNLDEQSTIELGETIQSLKAEGKTVLIAEHRIYFLMDVVDRILYMEGGEIKQEFEITEFKKLNVEVLGKMGLRSIVKPEMNKNLSMHKNEQSYLDIRNVSVKYEKPKHVICYENIQMPKGEIIALVGKNGHGKSTLSRVITGLQKHCKSEIYIDGIATKSKDRVKACYLVMQDVNHQLFTESVTREINLGAKDLTEEKFAEIVKDLELETITKEHPMNLSGGQKQRVVIASAISSGKKIVVLDEPTSGLDYKQMQNVSKALYKLRENVDMIIVVTHDMEFINACCTQFVQLL